MDAYFSRRVKCNEQAITSDRVWGVLPREQIIPEHLIGAAAHESVRHLDLGPGPLTVRLAKLGVGHYDFSEIPVADEHLDHLKERANTRVVQRVDEVMTERLFEHVFQGQVRPLGRFDFNAGAMAGITT